MAKFDVIVFGASSFVGQILCQYYTNTYGVNGDLKWAAAGRNLDKLTQVKRELGAQAEALTLLTANADDANSLATLCKQTKVIISTVGPYALYGENMVKACVESGTDYCDLTGEVQFIRSMLDKYETQAQETGARIIHCCGFDSVPSDIGTYFLQQAAQKQFKQPCSTVRTRVKAAKGGASGGTIASMLNLVKEATVDRELRKNLRNPYWIAPNNGAAKVKQPETLSPNYDDDHQQWTAPFIMEGINARVVHRSNGLLNYAYGLDFKYNESMLMGKGASGRFKALGIAGAIASFTLAASVPPVRWLMTNTFLPKPGEGPTPTEQKNGFYDLRITGHTADGNTLQIAFKGDADPGYGSTAKLLGQAGACLAKDITRRKVKGGFWTPASALGDKYIARLREYAGVTLDIIK